ncbi:hypothetical protein A5781_03430 [Mycobacterium sp. 852002-30065_SCH5024008]|nr:hypothetical protein A5781_03430 [Mycobacterium sp. 852002-30065_SCH5024008]
MDSPLHETVVTEFAHGWAAPHPHAWDDLLDENVVLRQPLLVDGRGRAVWQRELARLLTFLPDLRGQVVSWAGRGDVVFIDITCTGTAGRRPLSFRAVDRLTINAEGKVLERDSFFDPMPLAATLARRPAAWIAWWRSGVGPLLVRRKLL